VETKQGQELSQETLSQVVGGFGSQEHASLGAGTGPSEGPSESISFEYGALEFEY
jgi:hypothetical protein